MEKAISVHAAQVVGIEAVPVEVEAALDGTIPGTIRIVGMPDTSALEAASRVKVAIRTGGYEMPSSGITINLSPSTLRKTGTGYDLPIAVAILALSGQIPREGIERILFSGELHLDGRTLPCRGDAARAKLAREMGLDLVVADRALPCWDGHVRACANLTELRAGAAELPAARPINRAEDPRLEPLDYSEIAGHETEKRALVIAAAGGHNLLMVGPAGAGKTMLARRLPTIMAPMNDAEKELCQRIADVCGALNEVYEGSRPFRAPHWSISLPGLIGGGCPIIPGEVTLSHGGVLFLDELQNFTPAALQGLRAALGEGEVRIARQEEIDVFPAEALVVGAAPPCPCGHLGDPSATCTCSPQAVGAYQERLGGPLAPLFDMRVDVARASASEYLSDANRTSSSEMLGMVGAAREFRAWRIERGIGDVIDDAGRETLLTYCNSLGIGGQAVARLLSVGRTVADLAGREKIGVEDAVEALSFRNPRAGGPAHSSDIAAARAARGESIRAAGDEHARRHGR